MLPKQIEMDGIVKDIYEAIQNEAHLESTLFVLCGDHGMNDGGNHGGSAPGETSPALVFMSPKLKTITNGTKCPTIPTQDFDYYTKIEQSDIAPTLAGLLGFPVPLNNLGVFIPEFLSFWSSGSFNQLVHDTKKFGRLLLIHRIHRRRSSSVTSQECDANPDYSQSNLPEL